MLPHLWSTLRVLPKKQELDTRRSTRDLCRNTCLFTAWCIIGIHCVEQSIIYKSSTELTKTSQTLISVSFDHYDIDLCISQRSWHVCRCRCGEFPCIFSKNLTRQWNLFGIPLNSNSDNRIEKNHMSCHSLVDVLYMQCINLCTIHRIDRNFPKLSLLRRHMANYMMILINSMFVTVHVLAEFNVSIKPLWNALKFWVAE